MKVFLLAAVLLGLLSISVWWAIDAWNTAGEANLGIHGHLALGLMIVFSLLVGCGLMAVMFYSSRKGYDEPPDLDRR